LSRLELAFFYVNVIAKAALTLRLFLSGLHAVYRSFFLYLAFDLTESVILAIVPFDTEYRNIYMAGHGIKVILGVLVVMELYRVALAGQPALSAYGQRTVAYFLVAAMLLAAGGLRLDSSIPAGQPVILHYFLSFERTMDAWLMGFLVIISLFMGWFPVRVKRNVVFYIAGFVLYFFSRSTGLLLTNMLPTRFARPVSIAMLGVSFGCLLTLLLALRREGEEATVVVGHVWNPAEVEHLTSQLDAINASLVRLSRP
jgi:hypothetical protein